MEQRITFLCKSCDVAEASHRIFRAYVALVIIIFVKILLSLRAFLFQDDRIDINYMYWGFWIICTILLIATAISMILIKIEKQENVLFVIAPMIPIILFIALSVLALLLTTALLLMMTIPLLFLFISLFYVNYRIYSVKKNAPNYNNPIQY